MLSSCGKRVGQLALQRVSALHTCGVVYASKSELPAKPKGFIPLPDPWEHAVGVERFEMAMKKIGIDDPYDMGGKKRIENSTKDNPNIVSSTFDRRLIGCVCEEDATTIVWMWIYDGEAQRCRCGHWFKLVEYQFPKELDQYELPAPAETKQVA
ncbi:hypothetical protein SNEBB_010181 [Seison nebaliae]|nr:hypothetical protein SNEBB_010181 [Seison nebaliae]